MWSPSHPPIQNRHAGPVLSELRQTFSPAHKQRWRLLHRGVALDRAWVTHTVGPLAENREVRYRIRRGAACRHS